MYQNKIQMAVLTNFYSAWDEWMTDYASNLGSNWALAETKRRTKTRLFIANHDFFILGRDELYTESLAEYDTMLDLLDVATGNAARDVTTTDLQTFFTTGGSASINYWEVEGDYVKPKAQRDLMINVIDELTTDIGVTVESVKFEDGAVDTAGILTIDTINEHTTDGGVTWDTLDFSLQLSKESILELTIDFYCLDNEI